MKNNIILCQFEKEKYNIPYFELGRWNAYMIALSRFEMDCGQTQIQFSDAFSKYRANITVPKTTQP
jgi:hypothetical protein